MARERGIGGNHDAGKIRRRRRDRSSRAVVVRRLAPNACAAAAAGADPPPHAGELSRTAAGRAPGHSRCLAARRPAGFCVLKGEEPARSSTRWRRRAARSRWKWGATRNGSHTRRGHQSNLSPRSAAAIQDAAPAGFQRTAPPPGSARRAKPGGREPASSRSTFAMPLRRHPFENPSARCLVLLLVEHLPVRAIQRTRLVTAWRAVGGAAA